MKKVLLLIALAFLLSFSGVTTAFAQGNLPPVPSEGTALYTYDAAKSGGEASSAMTSNDVGEWSSPVDSDIPGYGKLQMLYRSLQPQNDSPEFMYYKLEGESFTGSTKEEFLAGSSAEGSVPPVSDITKNFQPLQGISNFFGNIPWMGLLLGVAWSVFCYFVVFPQAQASQEIKTLVFDLSGLVAKDQGIMKLHLALQCKLSSDFDEMSFFKGWEDVRVVWESATRNYIGTRLMSVPLEEVVTTLQALLPKLLVPGGIILDRKGVIPLDYTLAAFEYEQSQQDAMSAKWKAKMRNLEIQALLAGMENNFTPAEASEYLAKLAFAEGLSDIAQGGIKVNIGGGSQ